MTLLITGITKKGKQRVYQFGNKWRVLKIVQTVLFSDSPGPWLLVVPETHFTDSIASRWIHKNHDVDFSIKK